MALERKLAKEIAAAKADAERMSAHVKVPKRKSFSWEGSVEASIAAMVVTEEE